MNSLSRFALIFTLISPPFFPDLTAEERETPEPLPSCEDIAKLPADGGEEFNRLIFSQSPYLLQHARNPIDWHEWGDSAFEKAITEDKPIFLSIGYTTCHWCHVMEHESFADPEVATMINDSFIPVKVDREERPDIDEVYMTFTMAMNQGKGGWPMTVIMTPEKKPFFAGTYFPKQAVLSITDQITDAWENNRDEVLASSSNITTQLKILLQNSPGGELPTGILDTAFQEFKARFDTEKGGFSEQPKFPQPGNLMFLLRYHQRTGNTDALAMVEKTLQSQRLGGIYDHIGYGIHRYAIDRDWLVPHFEKMLYDQALFAIANIECFQSTGDKIYANTVREILEYVSRDMTSPEGGFYSAEDADSEGEEGKFYTWSKSEITDILGETDAQLFTDTYQIREQGNYLEEVSKALTGQNIPHLGQHISEDNQQQLETIRAKLFAQRETRVRPQKDDKILTDWNGLMISAYARAGIVLKDPEYKSKAVHAAEFILKK
ncbi:MAG: thioredoxin domain-containing protein, partial [Verrucomicrobiota bacterium]